MTTPGFSGRLAFMSGGLSECERAKARLRAADEALQRFNATFPLPDGDAPIPSAADLAAHHEAQREFDAATRQVQLTCPKEAVFGVHTTRNLIPPAAIEEQVEEFRLATIKRWHEEVAADGSELHGDVTATIEDDHVTGHRRWRVHGSTVRWVVSP